MGLLAPGRQIPGRPYTAEMFFTNSLCAADTTFTRGAIKLHIGQFIRADVL